MSGYASQKHQELVSTFRLGASRSPDRLRNTLSAAVIGQSAAIDATVRALTISAAGLSDPHRPIASLLMVGPTGVGKTELARQLAAEVRGDRDNLCRIDMNALAQEHYSASLSGAPPGYSGSREAYTLFQRERIEGNLSVPGIVLFDEIEKAHVTVLRSLLQILDTGILRLAGGGAEISFRNCIVLMTSNLGSREVSTSFRNRIRRAAVPFGSSRTARVLDRYDRATVETAVRRFFDPELYNRFDEVITFDPLDHDTSRQVVDLELVRLADRLRAAEVTWQYSDDVAHLLLRRGFDPVYGARNLKRVIRTDLESVVAEQIVRHRRADVPLRLGSSVESGEIVTAVADGPGQAT